MKSAQHNSLWGRTGAACGALLAMSLTVATAPALAQGELKVSAASAVVVDLATGTVIYEKNARQRRPMASTTKIMTGTLIVESNRLNEWVPISKYAAATDYANLHAKPGEQLPMSDLLYAIMLRSSNDGCVAAGEFLAGSERGFVDQMNRKAREIGLTDTNFVTTNGLYHENHYSTALDLARMARYATQYPLFNEVVRTQVKKITRSINTKDSIIENHNKFLKRYPGADGMKTGYVRQSGKCLVATATRMEQNYPWRLVTVVLNSNDTYGDSQAMMDYAFKNFQPVFFAHRGQNMGSVEVAGGVRPRVDLVAREDVLAIAPRGAALDIRHAVEPARDLTAPVSASESAGTLTGYIDGRAVTHVSLAAAAPVERTWKTPATTWATGSVLSLAVLLVIPRYARAFTKGPRRRRRRIAAGSRNADLGGSGEGEWGNDPGAGNPG